MVQINLVSIFRCSSPPNNPVYVRRVDPLVLAFCLSLHRQSYKGLLYPFIINNMVHGVVDWSSWTPEVWKRRWVSRWVWKNTRFTNSQWRWSVVLTIIGIKDIISRSWPSIHHFTTTLPRHNSRGPWPSLNPNLKGVLCVPHMFAGEQRPCSRAKFRGTCRFLNLSF